MVEQFAHNNAGKIRVVGIGGSQSIESNREFLAEFGVETPLTVQGGLWSAFGIRRTPSVVMTDASGNVLLSSGGFPVDQITKFM